MLRRLAKSVLNDMQADCTGEFPNLRLDLADITAGPRPMPTPDCLCIDFPGKRLSDAPLFHRSTVLEGNKPL